MIEKTYKKERIVICDNCGEGRVCDSWADAIDFMNEEGWKKKLVDGEWKHYCPECQESEVEHDAMCCEDCPCVNYCGGSIIEACMDDWRKRKQRESEGEHDG